MSKVDKTEETHEAEVPESTTTQDENFNTKTWRTDLALIVEDKILHVSKLVLAIASPVFEAMFNGEFSEKDKDEIEMPGKKYNDILEFLRCIYPNTLQSVTPNIVNVVLPLAEEYQVAKLKASCESCLVACLTDDISTEQLYDILSRARLFDLQRVTERGIDIASSRPYNDADQLNNDVPLARVIKDEIRVRMLQKMDKKCKDLVQYVKTSRTVCKFLGEVSKYKQLTSMFLDGHGVANDCSILIVSEFDKTVNISVDGIPCTIRIGKSGMYVCAFIMCSLTKHINCFIAVVVQNWMKGKDDIIETSNHFQIITNSETELRICTTKQLLNQEAGFIYQDIVKIDVYLFAPKHIA